MRQDRSMGVTICPMSEDPVPPFWARVAVAGGAARAREARPGLPKLLSDKIIRFVRGKIGEIDVGKPTVAWGLTLHSEARPVQKVSR